jgi:hypothetical protein
MITLTQSRVDRVIELTRAGESRPRIARTTRLNEYRVWQVQAAYDLTRNPAPVRRHQRELVHVRAHRAPAAA